MGTLTGAKMRRLEEDEEDLDRISRLPDAILGEIVSLLPTKDGARTQVISSRWRHLWRSAPLNFDLGDWWEESEDISEQEISGILSSHPGPGRRFIPGLFLMFSDHPTATLDGWLQSPALGNLQELEFDYGVQRVDPLPPLPSSVHSLSPALRVASFSGCSGFPDGDNAGALQFPVLKQLSLSRVSISDSSMHALLSGCPVLESLLLRYTNGCSCIRIVSPSLRSIGLHPGWEGLNLQQVVIEDAPSLDRLLLLKYCSTEMVISVISAPKLHILGRVSDRLARLQFGTTIFQGSQLISLTTLMPNMKVLALSQGHLSLDVVINFMKCFPCLEKLYIESCKPGEKNVWFHKYLNLVDTLDIRLKKIVLINYRGNKSHINFAKFFVLNASVLQSMILEVDHNISGEWIEMQHRLLETENRASRGALVDFVYHNSRPGPLGSVGTEVAHDLSTADPFVRLHDWSG